MKRLCILGGMLLLAGVVMILLPYHVAMTGIVLVLLGAAVLLAALLGRKATARKETAISMLAVLASVGVSCLMASMGLIITGGQPDWDRAEQSEYAVVLGAAVHAGGQPSRILRTRIYAALEFMEKNPDGIVILSGGQGADEPIPEAECMYNTLVELGADPGRLIQEGESHTTRENLINSMEIIESRGGTSKSVTLITSEFHQRRADYIADSLSLDTCPVSAETPWFYRVNYTLREVFAFVKAAAQSGT